MRKGYCLVLALLAAGSVSGAEWYRSNAAGMALEYIPSRATALRRQYSLSVETSGVEALPEPLQGYYKPSYRVELHTLYENGQESRRQWIFRNEAGKAMLVSSVSAVIPDEPEPSVEAEPEVAAVENRFTGFIEIYTEDGLLSEEHQLSEDGTETITSYFYVRQLLIRAETTLKSFHRPVPAGEETEASEESPAAGGETLELVVSDYYRYNRSHGLRAMERVYHQAVSADQGLTRLQFPHLGLHPATEEAEKPFVSPSTAYASEFMQAPAVEFPSQVVYTTDERGRVLTEIARDEEGTILREVHNTWVGDRLEGVAWKSGEDERSIEYGYDDAGDRILERDYTNGVLERLVRWDKGRETEELYLDGELVLRAIWEEGRKISEERIRPQRKGRTE
ncbi:MAG: hypothetical protein LBQ30_02170 [Treponema sp.]|nr:hypothetical protein [Treponema sp.]